MTPRGAAVVVAAVVLLATTAAAAAVRPPSGSGETAVASSLERIAHVSTLRTTSVRATNWWGGTYTTPSGARIRLYFSDAYLRDDARASAWVAFFDGLLHGPELADLTAYFAPPAVITELCGESAIGCYAVLDEALAAPGEDVPGVSTTAEIVEHEYGHHVANNRRNDPWPAIDWGPKRWATRANVCERVRAHTAFPGDEGEHYRLNPGEAFAEAYRVVADARRGAQFTWGLVDASFTPDEAVLAAAAADAVDPWHPTTRTIHGRLPAPLGIRTSRVTAAYDGTLTVTLSEPRRARVVLTLVDAKTGAVVARSAQSVSTSVCGSREFVLRLRTISGSGRFALRIVSP